MKHSLTAAAIQAQFRLRCSQLGPNPKETQCLWGQFGILNLFLHQWLVLEPGQTPNHNKNKHDA